MGTTTPANPDTEAILADVRHRLAADPAFRRSASRRSAICRERSARQGYPTR